jgi:type IV pilus assembly protein PilN
LAGEEKKDQAQSSIVPRVEESYGTFTVTADLDSIAQPELTGAADAAAPAGNAAPSGTATSAPEAAK